MAIDFTNFFTNTRAVFTPCEMPERSPDFISDSNSQYWCTGEGVIRFSDHWKEQSSCNWTLSTKEDYEYICAYCPYTDFKTKKLTAIYYEPTSADLRLLKDLLASGGAVKSSEWVTGSGKFTSLKEIPYLATKDTKQNAPEWAQKLVSLKTRQIVYITDLNAAKRLTEGKVKKVKVGAIYR